jgi:hypothetical protein
MTIILTTTSHLQTGNVKARLYLPGLSVLRRGSDSTGRPEVLPVGEKLPAAARFNRGMGKGQSVRKQVTVRPAKPGYYMLSAAVWAPGAEHVTKGGVPIDNGQSSEFWIWISEDGGQVTSRFDPTLFPEGYVVAPGPLTSKDQLTDGPLEEGDGQKTKAKQASGDTKIKFTRFDPIEGIVKPISGFRVCIKEEDEYSGDEERYTKVTDENGVIRFGCDPYGYESYKATLRASGGGSTVLNNAGNSVVARGETWEAACGYTNEARASAAQYFVWQEMKRIKGRSENFYGGLSRGSITVKLDGDRDGAVYTPDDEIILDKDTYGTSDLSDFNLFTMAHEYGHAYHEKAIGGYATDGNCPRPHYFSGAYDLDCAFTEGYADFHGAATVADSNFYKSFIERTPGTYNYPASAPNDNDDLSKDGSVIESTVAAFLYDLTDPKNESHDNLDFPGRYVADVLGTCGGQANGGGFYEANGADHLVACLQLQTPPYSEKYDGTNYYFGTRSYSLRADGYVTEDADEPSGWNRPDIRELWHYTLYKDTP